MVIRGDYWILKLDEDYQTVESLPVNIFGYYLERRTLSS